MATAMTRELRSPGINSASGAGRFGLPAGPKTLAARSLANGAVANGAEPVAGSPAGPTAAPVCAAGIAAGPRMAAWSQASYSVRVWGFSRQLLADASWPRTCCA